MSSLSADTSWLPQNSWIIDLSIALKSSEKTYLKLLFCAEDVQE